MNHSMKRTVPFVLWLLLPTMALGQAGVANGKSPTPTAAQSRFQEPLIQSPQSDGYLLGPGDRVKLDFFNVPEFTGEYQILSNGAINLPLVGEVLVKGRTLKQATDVISAKYAPILQRRTITMSLLIARPIQVAIAGEVSRPGSYTLSSGGQAADSGGVSSISRTIQLAEGITQAADLRRVQIRRPQPVGSGSDKVFTVDLWALLQTGDLRQDLRLQDGDSIFIPATTTVDLAESRQLAAANFAARNNRPLKVSVVGEVARPGPYTLLEGAVGQPNQLINPNLLQVPSVTRAIQIAGGITQSADIRNIQVRRLTRSGPPQLIKLDFWQLLKAGDVLQDLPLQDGDTVEIPTAQNIPDREISELASASFSPDKIVVNVTGEVQNPGAISVPPSAPLNQALLSAGGFNIKAKKRAVTLIRINPNGSVSKRDVNVDLAQNVNSEGNPPLRNGDIIIVKKSGFATFADGVGQVLAPFNGILNFVKLFGL